MIAIKASIFYLIAVCSVSSFKCRCGTYNYQNHILGGAVSNIATFPWQASLLVKGKLLCGGSLITDRHVITTANCTNGLKSSELQVGLQEQFLSTSNSPLTEVKVANIEMHPKYNEETQDFDFSILTLSSPQIFSPELVPICLPIDPTRSYEGEACYVPGWIKTPSSGEEVYSLVNKLVLVISRSDCAKTYKKLSSQMICTIRRNPGTWIEEKGGSLAFQDIFNFELVGMVSFGQGVRVPNSPFVNAGRKLNGQPVNEEGRIPGTPIVNAKIPSVLSWIHQHIKGGITCPRN